MGVSRSDEERIAALIHEVRGRMVAPARVLVVAGVAQIGAAVAVYALGKITGHLPVALAGILLVTPGPILLIAARQIARLDGWNLIFGGLMSGVGLWSLTFFVLAYEGLGSWVGLPLTAIVAALVVVVRFAGLMEDGAVRLARGFLDPQAPRDPADRGPW